MKLNYKSICYYCTNKEECVSLKIKLFDGNDYQSCPDFKINEKWIDIKQVKKFMRRPFESTKYSNFPRQVMDEILKICGWNNEIEDFEEDD